MPDITMCKIDSDQCPHTGSCRRHEDSGTVPDMFRQSYLATPERDCAPGDRKYYLLLPVKGGDQ